jgi:hypothetical protein
MMNLENYYFDKLWRRALLFVLTEEAFGKLSQLKIEDYIKFDVPSSNRLNHHVHGVPEFDEIFIGTDSSNIDICIPKLHYRSNTD